MMGLSIGEPAATATNNKKADGNVKKGGGLPEKQPPTVKIPGDGFVTTLEQMQPTDDSDIVRDGARCGDSKDMPAVYQTPAHKRSRNESRNKLKATHKISPNELFQAKCDDDRGCRCDGDMSMYEATKFNKPNAADGNVYITKASDEIDSNSCTSPTHVTERSNAIYPTPSIYVPGRSDESDPNPPTASSQTHLPGTDADTPGTIDAWPGRMQIKRESEESGTGTTHLSIQRQFENADWGRSGRDHQRSRGNEYRTKCLESRSDAATPR